MILWLENDRPSVGLVTHFLTIYVAMICVIDKPRRVRIHHMFAVSQGSAQNLKNLSSVKELEKSCQISSLTKFFARV